jgi:putative aldouronate transport system permease protein
MVVKRLSAGRLAGMVIIYGSLTVFCIICIFPVLNVFFNSISDEASVLAGEIKYAPKNVHWNAYRYVIDQRTIFRALWNTVKVVAAGTIISLMSNGMAAYALSRNRFREREFVLGLYIFIMIFTAGLIPGYLMVRDLGLYNTLWALILPAAINPFYLLIMKSFTDGIPDSIEDAAKIDGAGNIRTYFRIILPISKPVMASMCLYFAVDYWNDFFRPMIYLTSNEKYTLQLYLRSLLINTTDLLYQNAVDISVYGNVAPQSIQNAAVIISVIPILLLYPFLQRYFVQGITLGSVKG